MPMLPRSSALTTFTVKASGEPLPERWRVLSIEIERMLDRVTRARIVLHDGDAAAQTFTVSENSALEPGADIEIDAGYDRHESRVFKGVVTRQRIEAGRRGDTRLHVEAKDPVFRAALGRRSRVFVDLSDADAITDALAGEGVTVEIEPSAVHGQIVQHQVSGWDFALQRASALGLVCDCDGGRVRFFAPDLGEPPVARFEFGRDLYRLDLEADAESALTTVAVGAWNAAEQALTVAETDDAPAPNAARARDLAQVGGARDAPRHAGGREEPALDVWARALLGRSRLAGIRGVVEVQGRAGLAPGDQIELAGVGARFNGAAFVSGVRHEIGRGDWLTSIQIGLDPRFPHERRRLSAPAAAGLIPPVHGLQIGVVSALEGDPSGEPRIEVRLPTAGDDGRVWARLASIDAGADRGAVFRPEIGDEVVLGFLDADPRDPVVLGALHSSAHAPPIEGADDNPLKGYVSRSGMKLIFDDDAPAVLIETRGGAALRLDDGGERVELTDSHGNVLTMEATAMTLAAKSDLKIEAGGNVTIEGVNVDVKASVGATVEGSASAKLEGGAQTTVKGALVMIN